MTGRVWLASYPKSGNTWLRLLIGCLSLKDGEQVDINKSLERGGIASARGPFDKLTLIDSALLTHDEIDALRPRVYEEMVRRQDELDADEDAEDSTGFAPTPVRFVKVHDAYTQTARGEPLLAGLRFAKGAIVIARDPRDVAPSLANQNRSTVDAAIRFMNDADATFCGRTDLLPNQFRQRLPGWSGHVASWLDQRDIPVHLARYEDFKRDTVGALRAAMQFAGYDVTAAEAERAASLASFGKLQAQERETGFSEWKDRGAGGRWFFRRGEIGSWRDELTAEQVSRIEAAHGAMMTRMGYELSTATART